jgi:hypothetical protein
MDKKDKLKVQLKDKLKKEMSMTGTGAFSTPGTGEGVATKYAFSKYKNKGTPKDWKAAPSIPNRKSKMIDYKELWEEESINENYARFRNETKTRNKSEQFHSAVKQVKKKVNEINKLFEYMSRLQNELKESEGGLQTKKYTENALQQIKEATKQLFLKSTKLK